MQPLDSNHTTGASAPSWLLDSIMQMLARLFLIFVLATGSGTTSATRSKYIGEYFDVKTLHYMRYDNIRGHKQKAHSFIATIKSDCGSEFTVEVGSYIGKNDGRIIKITKASIFYVELVPDGDGGWLERENQLQFEPTALK